MEHIFVCDYISVKEILTIYNENRKYQKDLLKMAKRILRKERIKKVIKFIKKVLTKVL